MFKQKSFLTIILVIAILFTTTFSAKSATDEEMIDAIDKGIAWLLTQRNPDGSFGNYEYVAMTGFAVVKLQDRARELQTDEYDDEIQAGLDYIFSQATINPYGAGSGICFAKGSHETYNTGIAMMAIANDGDTSETTTDGPFTGETYKQILEGNVQFFEFSQNPDGGWRYWAGLQPSDQSNTGYAVLGLSYAENAGIAIPASVKTNLVNWINIIQDPVNGDTDDGGSWYEPGWSWVNLLKTGNLIFEMTFAGIGPGDARFDAAIDYIERHWLDGNVDPGWGYGSASFNYQAMYCLMKGLEYSGIDEIDTNGDTILEDWFNQDPPDSPAWDLASVIVASQNSDGSWTDGYWGDTVLGTCWALLTLEKVTVVPTIEVTIDIKPTSYPNPLNVGSKGVLPIAICGTQDFDVLAVDPDSILLEGVTPLRFNYEDVCTAGDQSKGPDGLLDLTLKFDKQQIEEAIGDVEDGETVFLKLTGKLQDSYGGNPIEGVDVVVILKKGK